MTDTARNKRPHELFRCMDPKAFARDFSEATGEDVGAVARRASGINAITGVVLGGSIPLGIGTSVSDVDLLVLTDPQIALELPPSGTGGVLHAGEFSTVRKGLVRGEVVMLCAGIEVNCQLLSQTALADAAAQLEKGRISQTPHEFGHLSRLRTGWVLDGETAMTKTLAPLRTRNTLDLHCSAWYLVAARLGIEDARAALEDSLLLAQHLARGAVEHGVLAWFGSQGFGYVGSKWLRALEPARAATPLGKAAASLPGRTVLPELLFPSSAADKATAAAYVNASDSYVGKLRKEMESDRRFAVAFALSPQL